MVAELHLMDPLTGTTFVAIGGGHELGVSTSRMEPCVSRSESHVHAPIRITSGPGFFSYENSLVCIHPQPVNQSVTKPSAEDRERLLQNIWFTP